jgi:hypothetical protein
VGVYVTVAEVYAEGVPASVPPARINARILKWEAIVEQITRNIFREISPGPLVFDGNDAQLMHFSLPLITVSSIKINDLATELAADEFRAFTGRSAPQDDRKNPKIKLTPIQSSIFRDTNAVFVKGLNQTIDSTWGYVEDDPANPGSFLPPRPVKDAIIELVTLDLEGYFTKSTEGVSLPLSSVRRERTDGHEIEYQQVDDVRIVWSMIPTHIADILALYRSPWAIRSPDVPRFLPSVLLGVSVFRE